MSLRAGVVGPSWDDPKYKNGILAKGKRKPRTVAAIQVEESTDRRKCDWCGFPIYVLLEVRCRCTIWDYMKPKKA